MQTLSIISNHLCWYHPLLVDCRPLTITKIGASKNLEQNSSWNDQPNARTLPLLLYLGSAQNNCGFGNVFIASMNTGHSGYEYTVSDCWPCDPTFEIMWFDLNFLSQKRVRRTNNYCQECNYQTCSLLAWLCSLTFKQSAKHQSLVKGAANFLISVTKTASNVFHSHKLANHLEVGWL